MRPFVIDDADAAYREIYSDEEVVRHYSGGGVHADAERTRAQIASHLAAWEEETLGRHAVLRHIEGDFIGQVHLNPWVCDFPGFTGRHASVEVELAFAFAQRVWGTGYAVEACQELIRHVFDELRLPRLAGVVVAANQRSLGFHRKLGYRMLRHPDPGQDWWLCVLDNPS